MSNEKNDIIGVGSPVVDALAHVNDDFLKEVPGDKGGMVLVDADMIGTIMSKLDQPPVEAPGGSAGNTLFALARLGLNTSFLGKIGNDSVGAFFKNRFEELGGDSSSLKTGDRPNGRCISLITPDSERTMRTDLGAAMTLSPEEISAGDFANSLHAHIEGYLLFNPDLMNKVLESAKGPGRTISLDLASFEVVNAAKDDLPRILENYIDLVFANEEEAEAFCGEGKSYQDMALELNKYCKVAVVKVGKEGAYIAQNGEVQHVDAVTGVKAIDTTGAGDYWAAGFLFGWLRGKPLKECGQFGSIMGAAVVQVDGTLLSDAMWEDLKKQLA